MRRARPLTRPAAPHAPAAAVLALGVWLAATVGTERALAAPPREEKDPPKPRVEARTPAAESAATEQDSAAVSTPQPMRPIPHDAPLPEAYRGIVRGIATRTRADTVGTGFFLVVRDAFHKGDFERASSLAQQFVERHPRNLNVNDALEMTLLLREYRDFEDKPLRAYTRALGLREAGARDSAVLVVAAGLERYPGAKIRHHGRFLLAELAYERGDHAGAVAHALAVADTTTKSRLAPYALLLAGDATLASGAGPDKATRYYQEVLVRFPDSPLAPAVRAKLLSLRKGMQL